MISQRIGANPGLGGAGREAVRVRADGRLARTSRRSTCSAIRVTGVDPDSAGLRTGGKLLEPRNLASNQSGPGCPEPARRSNGKDIDLPQKPVLAEGLGRRTRGSTQIERLDEFCINSRDAMPEADTFPSDAQRPNSRGECRAMRSSSLDFCRAFRQGYTASAWRGLFANGS